MCIRMLAISYLTTFVCFIQFSGCVLLDQKADVAFHCSNIGLGDGASLGFGHFVLTGDFGSTWFEYQLASKCSGLVCEGHCVMVHWCLGRLKIKFRCFASIKLCRDDGRGCSNN